MRGSQPWRANRARILRDAQSSAEVLLWQHLRNRQLGGHKFARQAPIAKFFADFICRERRLVVEVDGGTHATHEELRSDAHREAELARLGYRVFRIRNDEVYVNVEGVLESLLAELEKDA